MTRLQMELGERRHELHGKLVETWGELEQDRFFYRLLEKMKGHPGEEVCPLRVALISDVHGNEAALRAVLAHARERGVTAILHAGDAIGAPGSDRSIDLLRGADVLSVQGNMDRTALDSHRARRRTGDVQLDMVIDGLSERGWEWLNSLPHEVRLDICGRTIFMTHAAPGEDGEKLLPSTPDARLGGFAKGVRADVIVTGHSHIPMVREAGRSIFVNPGSVGRPRDGPEASYAIMEFPSLERRHHRVRYDATAVADELRSMGLIDLAEVIEKGRNDDRTVTIGQWALPFHRDQDHAEQVRTVALQLFDQTRGLHRMGGRERGLLELAALVHDVGLGQGAEGHQRRALDLIMEADLPLERKDRSILACVARYHGCRPPREDDRVYRDLDQKDRKRVRKLSALLALADGLDRGHACRVRGLKAKVGRKEVRLMIEGEGPMALEMEWGGRKKCQFEKVFKRGLRLEQ